MIMRDSPFPRVQVQRTLFLLIIGVLAGCASFRPNTNCRELIIPSAESAKEAKSITTNKSAVDPLVENGDAYEKVSLALPPSIRRIAIPDDALVIRSDQQIGQVDIYLIKDLMFQGHPDVFTSIRTERKKMGAAVRIEGQSLNLALFGGFDSCIEGGWSISAAIVVPTHLQVSRKRRLEFRAVASGRWKGSKDFKPDEWFVLPTQPDPARHFDKYQSEKNANQSKP
jgi:hypothetical protein